LRSKTLASATLIIGAVVGCSGNADGPRYPPIGGDYAATFDFTFSNSNESQTLTVPGTISLSRPSRNGDFSGSYSYDPPYSGSGDILGTVAPDGSIEISEFGDDQAPPMVEIDFLSNEWSFCDFSSVTTTGMSGGLSGNTLSLQGELGFSCRYTNGSSVADFPTTLDETVTGS